ncbi:MAG: ABC transporter ATP-binding protein [Acidimicrobiia bacterium]|nr:ABC transporter ATP-binding protein [Acidimicrobiia bacterium]MBT8216121.1 ABC transporter ATP-binding protein [Acidimicrobiia bacterium]NNF09900.1 ABC transporter ATP-binding protein [Acidimicrobiia bacterium]NNL70527.1 ABC transporter ATP-binding protein [Acidimicrobiia bacterium]
MTTSPAFVASPTIEVNEVSKWFGQKVAVSNVSCSFGPGITGLLGPNGAGKTTLLRMMAGLSRPSRGDLRVLGTNPRRDTAVFQKVGLVPEDDAVYTFLTGRAFVEYGATLAGVRNPSSAAAHAITAVGMDDAADRNIEGYSKGMRQRIKVAGALVNDPEVLYLDEPLNGADPVQRVRLIELFHRLAGEGRTVVVSSHVLEEVEKMANRVIAMVDGRLAAAGDSAAIRAAFTDIPYRVRIEADTPRQLGSALLEQDVIRSVEVLDGTLHVQTQDLGELGRLLPGLAQSLDIRLTMMQPEDLSLESVFRYLVHGR